MAGRQDHLQLIERQRTGQGIRPGQFDDPYHARYHGDRKA